MQTKPFPILQTDRLILREITVSNVEDIFSYLSDPVVMRYNVTKPFKTMTEALNEILGYRKNFANNNGIWWGVSFKDDPKIIGSCSLYKYLDQTNIGYELHKEYWGFGITQEALTAILQYGFNQMGLLKVQALIRPENHASRKTVMRIGFKEEGLRTYDLAQEGLVELCLYSLLKKH